MGPWIEKIRNVGKRPKKARTPPGTSQRKLASQELEDNQ